MSFFCILCKHGKRSYLFQTLDFVCGFAIVNNIWIQAKFTQRTHPSRNSTNCDTKNHVRATMVFLNDSHQSKWNLHDLVVCPPLIPHHGINRMLACGTIQNKPLLPTLQICIILNKSTHPNKNIVGAWEYVINLGPLKKGLEIQNSKPIAGQGFKIQISKQTIN